jgi:uncharacterized protein YqeY
MSLIERLNSELKTAMKSSQGERLGVMRLVLAQIHNREKEKQATGQAPILTEEEILEVMQKEAKKRREAIELFKKGGREDLASKEEGELAIISEFLPAQMGREEIASIVDGYMKKGISDFASLIKEVMKEVKGKADGRLVSEVIKEKIG